MNQVIHGDCLEVMPNLPVDLIITDPPYLINYRSNRRQVLDRFDYIQNDSNRDMVVGSIKPMVDLLKDGSAIYMFCSWHHVDIFKQEIEKYLTLKNIIVWQKNNHGTGDLDGSYAPIHELILFAVKGRHKLRGTRHPDVIKCGKVNSSDLLHPTEKPIPLLELLVRASSDDGDTILDPFAGSGTTAIACLNTNRNYILIEKEQKYIDIINKNIAEHEQQQTLFN